MATEKQLKKLEYIEKRVITSKEGGKDPIKTLSRGYKGYEEAIRSIIRVGQWATITPIFALGVAIIKTVYEHSTVHNWAMNDQEVILLVAYFAISIVSIVLGKKLWELSATPISLLISLLIILFCNIALFIGVLPLITAILAIIALVRYSTFCSWFNGIKV